MKRSVLMVCSQYPPIYGGAGQQASLLAGVLARRGWKVGVVTLDQGSSGDTADGGVAVRRVARGLVATGGATRLRSTLSLGLTAALRVVVERPGVVHVHGSYWWSIPAVVMGRLFGSRVIVKVTRDGEDDPRTVLQKKFFRLPVGVIYSLTFRFASAIVFLNDAGLADSQTLGFGSASVRMHNGVDRTKLQRTADRRELARSGLLLDDSKQVVLFVGYLAAHKGVLDLLEAWPSVRSEDELELWLVGPRDGFYRELVDDIDVRIGALIAKGYAVRTFGHVEAEDMPRFYWAADVFTLPSYREGMPNSLAEAMTAGCDVVATRIPGIVDICEDAARLVLPGDSDGLASALTQALAVPTDIPEDLIARLDISVVADEYERLYEH